MEINVWTLSQTEGGESGRFTEQQKCEVFVKFDNQTKEFEEEKEPLSVSVLSASRKSTVD